MTCIRLAWRCAMLTLLCVGVNGCFSSGDGQVDEEKEPHYLRAKTLSQQSDFKGAVEMFDEALKVNPNSAAAHFELAVLYESQETVADPAAAIYHYERYLRFRPKAYNLDAVKNHIGSCKLELVKSVSALPMTPSMQRDFEKMLAENRELKLRVAQWQAYYNSTHPLPNTVSNAAATVTQAMPMPNPIRPEPRPGPAVSPRVATNGSLTPPLQVAPATNHVAAPAAPRTYTVKAGDLPAAIAKRHGVSLESLMAANPQLNPKRLKIGQSLNLPAQN